MEEVCLTNCKQLVSGGDLQLVSGGDLIVLMEV